LFLKSRNTTTEDDMQSPFSQVPIVEAAQARLGDMQHTLRLTGTLRPNDRAVIRSEIDAKIKKIHFQEGAFVDKGDILIELDNSRAMSTLKEAMAKLRHAESEYHRAKKLAEEQIVSTSECDRRLSEMESFRAQVDFQEVMLKKHSIYAPFDGIVGLKEISEGEFVNAGKELVLLVDYTPLKIDFRVPEMSLRHVSVGQTVRVHPNEFEQEFLATIIAIDPMGDSSAHSFIARAVLENQSISMRPGGFAEVFVPVSEGEQSILVPESAIERRGDSNIVYRIIDSVVVRTPVTIGERKDGEVEIISGVDEGEYVVTAGHMKVRDNKPVLIKESIARATSNNAESSTTTPLGAAPLGKEGNKEQTTSSTESSTPPAPPSSVEEGDKEQNAPSAEALKEAAVDQASEIAANEVFATDKKESFTRRCFNFVKGLFRPQKTRPVETEAAAGTTDTASTAETADAENTTETTTPTEPPTEEKNVSSATE
jgi:membrane fusion protein (multidrug efflux system)